MIGETGMETILKATCDKLVAATCDTAIACNAIKPAEFERIIVPITQPRTVQEKAIAYPVDSRLLEIARYKIVKAAKGCAMALRQTFAKEGKTLRRKAGGYAHARQFRRLARAIKRQRTIVGKLIREVRSKLALGAINTGVSPFTLSSLRARCSNGPIASARSKGTTSTNSKHCTPPRWNASARARPETATSLA